MLISEYFIELRNTITDQLPAVLQPRNSRRIKADNSFVTESDLMLESLITNIIKKSNPDIDIVAEESFDIRQAREHSYVAVIDPIDGTENFLSGLKEWGVSIGIWHNGQHLGSLLLMPELGLSLMTGDTFEKVPFSRITGFSSSYHDAIATGIKDAEEYRVMGCAVYNIYNVIHGSYCRFINPKGAYIWDLLPGLMLALEHGCEVYLDDQPYFGEFLDPTRKYRVDIRHRYDLHSRQGTER
jgi:myo-inositol-1(or 4)-monophosphatase